jgi:putative membrane protein
MDVTLLPHFEASCDIMAAILLPCGYYMIRRGNQEAHKACMLSAMLALVFSMGAYLVHKSAAGAIIFGGEGTLRTFYFLTLYGHVIAASLTMPLVAVVLYRAVKGDFQKHKKLAVWALPIWFFSSLTGVLIYFILFHPVRPPGMP